ncbi:MAG: hypothetical protein JNK15_02330 [Planctomycetes bacterium]|nr:hypothetical protein [Planctomycetota bacterium]
MRNPLSYVLAASLVAMASAQDQKPSPVPSALQAPDNPYRLTPFHADFPVPLEYPPRLNQEYSRTRRQILERLAENLQGNTRKETWHLATEFYWRAPDEAIEPLVAAMDRAFGNPALGDVVKNCVEAMGRMAREEFDAPLRRALQHKSPTVVQAAWSALCVSGKRDTLRELAAVFEQMDGRARSAWLRAVRLRLGDDGLPLLKRIADANYPPVVQEQLLREVLQLPMDKAAIVLKDTWPKVHGDMKAVVSGVLHAAGDQSGTVWLKDQLGSEDVSRLVLGIKHCAFGEPGVLREDLLRASTHLRAEVRHEAAKVLARVPGDDVADVFEVLAGTDEPWETRAIALRELTRRGRTRFVSAILDELPTANGTRLTSLVNELSASGDPRAVPVLVERFQKAPEGQGRPFLQGLAQNQSEAAAKALFEIFRGPVKAVTASKSEPLTTRSYLPTLCLNLRGGERVLLQEFLALPKDEVALRAAMLPTIAGFAADRTDPDLQQACIEPLRTILFDRSEAPQLRVLALNQLARRWLTIDDVLKLKNVRAEEQPGLRALFADFLNDAF